MSAVVILTTDPFGVQEQIKGIISLLSKPACYGADVMMCNGYRNIYMYSYTYTIHIFRFASNNRTLLTNT